MQSEHALVCLIVCSLLGCADGAESMTSREPTRAERSAHAGAGSPPLQRETPAGGSFGSQPLPPTPVAGANAQPPNPLKDCRPGVYTGMYTIDLLGSGPIVFDLVPGPANSGSVPCQEFCPELVLSSDGGGFTASWLGFEGRAKLNGGLDCRTGEFRAEMVDGQFGISADPSDPNAPLLLGGDLIGRFTGRFSAGTEPGIAGDIACNAGLDIEGAFSVNTRRTP